MVLDRIGQDLPIPQRYYSLTPREQLLLTLHWLGTGTYYHAIGDMHGPSKSSVCCIVKHVVNAIVDNLFQDVVRWPDNTDDIAPEFLRKGGFPCVSGCVDGTLIKIDAPTINEEQYVDRNGNHSLNVMVICGPDFSFYAVNSRWPGSVHDSRVLRTSAVSSQLENGWRSFAGAVILGKLRVNKFSINTVIQINMFKNHVEIIFTFYSRFRLWTQRVAYPSSSSQ